MKSIKGLIVSAILAVTMGLVIYNGMPVPQGHNAPTASKQIQSHTVTTGATLQLEFPSAKYPETAQYIKEAIAAGKSPVCTIDREGADHNRELSLKGVPTKKGKDRDEWPMAMCTEGGEGADIKYISPKDNRGAGSWVGHKLEEYIDGTKVEFIIK
ncbi:NucA/NucB deoxyribonuclease domain-containing protein [Paenibacillus sp. A3M_27_13]|uniref:NucA/NucB deoxyribonuclease domain-containing protein n=1 Tax=Paenibacillus sp. A3M_27_13 TaxID=2962029 RepID=UPI0020B81A97|nr:NucA/NucB deoxyribonuclease domain-containing protein [Paenibacillus sp. A3M_27_13]MCP3746692.1 NucA/NucB deoxyribonuclease domain-containing protein [Paenibacillus sp. A3M_27_13]